MAFSKEPTPQLKAAVSTMPLRTRILVVLLGVVALGATVSTVHLKALERNLVKSARKLEAEFYGPGIEVSSLVTVSKRYMVVGPAVGKVEVFYRREGDDASRIQGVEYLYERSDGDWHLRESVGCADTTCQVRGLVAFGGT